MSEQRPQIGVGVYICHEGKVLMFERIGKHGTGTWSAMGGHLEHGEHWFDTAKREAKEECGLDVHSPELFAVTNDYFPESGKHYVTMQVAVKTDSPNFQNTEPEKHRNLTWCEWENVPEPRFVALQSVYDQGYKPSYLEGTNTCN